MRLQWGGGHLKIPMSLAGRNVWSACLNVAKPWNQEVRVPKTEGEPSESWILEDLCRCVCVYVCLYIYIYIYIYICIYAQTTPRPPWDIYHVEVSEDIMDHHMNRTSLVLLLYMCRYTYAYTYHNGREIGPHERTRGPLPHPPTLGWHYLSNTTCLIWPHLFSTALITCPIRLIEFAALFTTFEENLR